MPNMLCNCIFVTNYEHINVLLYLFVRGSLWFFFVICCDRVVVLLLLLLLCINERGHRVSVSEISSRRGMCSCQLA